MAASLRTVWATTVELQASQQLQSKAGLNYTPHQNGIETNALI